MRALLVVNVGTTSTPAALLERGEGSRQEHMVAAAAAAVSHR
jgi:hypothetical protein